MTTPMNDNEYLFTSESVTEGHPDKIADQISDGVLDAVLRDDPTGRVACETLVNTGLVVVSGEITTETYVDIQYLRPDGKTQVTVRYLDGKPVEIEKILISTQHREGAEALLPDDLWEHVIEPILPHELYDEGKLRKHMLVNPTGRFVIGGPGRDAGPTGRAISGDTHPGPGP